MKSLFPEDEHEGKKPIATLEQIKTFCKEQELEERDAIYIYHHWEDNGWQRNGKPLKKWRSAIIAWKACRYFPSQRDQWQGMLHNKQEKPKPTGKSLAQMQSEMLGKEPF